MTKVDFYILSRPPIRERWVFACKLAEKAYKQSLKVTIKVDDPTGFSQTLWSFKPESFVPHSIKTEQQDLTPVVLTESKPSDHHDVLINLGSDVPDWFSQYDRVCEVVVQDPAILSCTRANFQFYRDRGYPLFSHKLD